jgi:transcriptional regulator with XRE-family HTH domain
MSDLNATLGGVIGEARKRLGISQKELAAKIKRAEDDQPISAQYLNDIEHNRRSPGNDHIISQFATILDLKESYLFFLANRVPTELRSLNPDQNAVDRFVREAAVAFRRQGNS